MRPIRVDVVGDFAGRGVFVIHREALLTYCLEIPALISTVRLSRNIHSLQHVTGTYIVPLNNHYCSKCS